MNVQKIIFEDSYMYVHQKKSPYPEPEAIELPSEPTTLILTDGLCLGIPEEWILINCEVDERTGVEIKKVWDHATLPLRCVEEVCLNSIDLGLGTCHCISHDPIYRTYFLLP